MTPGQRVADLGNRITDLLTEVQRAYAVKQQEEAAATAGVSVVLSFILGFL
jgi:hypothetical protein